MDHVSTCGGCWGIAELVSFVSGSVYDSPTYVTTRTTLGTTQFTFSSASLRESNVAPNVSFDVHGTITSPSLFWSIPAYSFVASVPYSTCWVGTGHRILADYDTSKVLPFMTDAFYLAQYKQNFVTGVESSCPSTNFDAGVTTAVSPIGSGLGSVDARPGSSTTAPAPNTQAFAPLKTTTSDAQSPTSTTSTNPKDSATPSSHAEAKIGIGIGAFVGTIIIVLLIIIFWRQERRRHKVKTRIVEKETRMWRWSRIPWLQLKGELDAEEQRRDELEAAGIQRELEVDMVYELPAEERRQELKGCEFVQELDVA